MAARKRGRDEGWIEVSVGQCDGYGALSLPLTKAHCTAIGLVMMQWAYIEREINSEIAWLLSRSENRGRKVSFQKAFSKRVADWLTLAKRVYKRPAEIAAIDSIAGKAIALKADRDDLAHGTFVLQGRKHIFLKFRDGKLIAIPDKFGTAADIEQLAHNVASVGHALLNYQTVLDRRYRKRP